MFRFLRNLFSPKYTARFRTDQAPHLGSAEKAHLLAFGQNYHSVPDIQEMCRWYEVRAELSDYAQNRAGEITAGGEVK